jgi:NAD(P)-dependent dehydrogenase (short-subunit alcohol dehydrogenase family)
MILDKFSLEDQVGIVTGGGQGLGEAFCLAFAEAGAHVVVAEQNPRTGSEMAGRLEAMGRKGLFVRTDVANPASARAMVEKTIETFGRVDFLMNNAGIVHWEAAETVSEADWRRVIDVNLNGVFFCCQAVAGPMMERRSGRIINIASMSGYIVNHPQSQASYNASKAAVVHLTRSLAAEWAPHNIRVNAIAPGYMRTALSSAYLDDPRLGGVWAEATPMKRVGRPEELGPLAVFLASEASSFVTGTTITADGGYTIW